MHLVLQSIAMQYRQHSTGDEMGLTADSCLVPTSATEAVQESGRAAVLRTLSKSVRETGRAVALRECSEADQELG